MSKVKLDSAPEIISAELYDDEELVWWGQPVASYLARQVSIPSIAMSAVMAIFAVGFFLFAQDMFAEASTSSFGGFGSRRGVPAIFPLMFTLIPVLCFLLLSGM